MTSPKTMCPGCQRPVSLTADGRFTLHYAYATGLGGQCPITGRSPGEPLRALCLTCREPVDINEAGRANFHRATQAATGCLGTGKPPEFLP